MLRQSRIFFVLAVSLLLSACGNDPSAPAQAITLVCEIQKPSSDYATPFVTYSEGHRITLTISKDEETLTVSNVLLGTVEKLSRDRTLIFEGQEVDPNFRRYTLMRQEPVFYEAQYNLNIVSGQLYHDAKSGAQLTSMYYANCSRVVGTLF